MSDNKIKQLEGELEKIKQQAKEYLEGWQRAKADYINREREIERDKSIWMEFITLDFILKILPIAESLEIAMSHKDKNEEFFKGVERIKKQFDDLLKSFGLERIKTIGEKFNPEFHEAVGRGVADGKEQIANNEEQTIKSQEPTTATAGSRYGGITNNIITEEVSPGYKMGGRVIKPAKVIIK